VPIKLNAVPVNRKYELTDETKTITVDGFTHTLHRIRRVSDSLDFLLPGSVGGWVESERNLTHEGRCFVYDEAMVFGRAVIEQDARIRDRAMVYGYAHVRGNARVADSARIHGSAIVKDADICGNADIGGQAFVYSHGEIGKDAVIREARDLLVVSPIGSEDGTLTIYRTATGCRAIRGCFRGTLDKFADAVKYKHDTPENHRFFHEYQLLIELARARFLTPAVNTTVADEEQAAPDETFALKS
jgi:carbonic anhydrase/acetyltransferase-like protein (isoleucine patch superfamily)